VDHARDRPVTAMTRTDHGIEKPLPVRPGEIAFMWWRRQTRSDVIYYDNIYLAGLNESNH
jgi:hypothetical protein